jgi:hypothetical protein
VCLMQIHYNTRNQLIKIVQSIIYTFFILNLRVRKIKLSYFIIFSVEKGSLYLKITKFKLSNSDYCIQHNMSDNRNNL